MNNLKDKLTINEYKGDFSYKENISLIKKSLKKTNILKSDTPSSIIGYTTGRAH